ncbi:MULTISPECIES: Ms4527A family Cys-rich leader peptide [Mycobacteriaceae]|uniref:Ms4527A family Cys-rich leader peptide n=1 Tax=Mycobacteriaceae TaxID=1762 RepID=UPI003907E87E
MPNGPVSLVWASVMATSVPSPPANFLLAQIPNLARLGRMPCSWQNGGVSASLNRTLGSALVMRRHVDFKRVCSCCCLP